MIIVAFSDKTSKILPQLICKKYKHVAPIIPSKNSLIMFQFVRPGHIKQIKLNTRDLKILELNGWDLIYIDSVAPIHEIKLNSTTTCVNMSKKMLRIRTVFIQTPFAFYKKLKSIT